jgi:DNA invertase Pin-like site-specific DNA recombinase
VQRYKATLLIAKLDRLARNVAFISKLMQSGLDFVAVDNPHANKLMMHMLAAFAEHERDQIRARTKAALAAAKARGVVLGRYGREVLSKQNHAEAVELAAALAPLITEFRNQGLTVFPWIIQTRSYEQTTRAARPSRLATYPWRSGKGVRWRFSKKQDLGIFSYLQNNAFCRERYVFAKCPAVQLRLNFIRLFLFCML